MMPMSIEAVRGVFAMLPAISTPEAALPEAPFAIDLEETRRATRAMVAAGVSAIMTNGSLGEMATLSHEEWVAFNSTVVSSAAEISRHCPVFVGATALGTRATIELAKQAQGFGSQGIFIGRPFWCALDPKGMISFYEAVAAAVPDMSIVVYDNPDAFKGPIPTSVYAHISHIPQYVAAKYIALTPKFQQDMAAVGDRLRLLPIEFDWLSARALWPDSIPACWSSTVSCGPGPVLALSRALAEKRMDDALDLTRRINHAYESFLATSNWPEFVKYNIPLEKLRFNAAGFLNAGPGRHPYHEAPAAYVEGSIEMARRWVALCKEYPVGDRI